MNVMPKRIAFICREAKLIGTKSTSSRQINLVGLNRRLDGGDRGLKSSPPLSDWIMGGRLHRWQCKAAPCRRARNLLCCRTAWAGRVWCRPLALDRRCARTTPWHASVRHETTASKPPADAVMAVAGMRPLAQPPAAQASAPVRPTSEPRATCRPRNPGTAARRCAPPAS